MSRAARKREMGAALARFGAERGRCRDQLAQLRRDVHGLPPTWFIAAGLGGGILAGLLPLRVLARMGRRAGALAVLILRAPQLPWLIGSVRRGWFAAMPARGASRQARTD